MKKKWALILILFVVGYGTAKATVGASARSSASPFLHVKRLAKSCDAEGLFFERLQGSDKVIGAAKQKEIIGLISHRYDQVSNPKRAERCLRSQWVMKLSENELRDLADPNHLDESHGLLTTMGFSDTDRILLASQKIKLGRTGIFSPTY